MKHCDSPCPFPLHFVAFVPRYREGAPAFAPTGGRTPDACGPGPLGSRRPSRRSSHGDHGASQVPGRTLARLPILLGPRGDLGARPISALRCCLRCLDCVRLSRAGLSRLNRSAIALAVYASQCKVTLAPRKTRFRLVANLCRAGLPPAGFELEGFFDGYVIASPFSRLRLAQPDPPTASSRWRGVLVLAARWDSAARHFLATYDLH